MSTHEDILNDNRDTREYRAYRASVQREWAGKVAAAITGIVAVPVLLVLMLVFAGHGGEACWMMVGGMFTVIGMMFTAYLTFSGRDNEFDW